MYSRPLRSKPHAQCHVEIDGTTITFVSYKTPVVICTPMRADCPTYAIEPILSGLYYDEERIYTTTTAQQISAFLAEFFQDVTYPMYRAAALKESGIAGTIREEALV